MTVIRPNSVSGITSITAQANEINFFRSNGTLAGLQLNGVNFNTTTGVSTFNNLDVGGVLTYQDVTNVDSVGIITARSGINCGGDLDITGQYLKIENAASPEIQLTDTNANNSLCFIRNSSGNLRLSADNNNAVADTSIRFLVDGGEKVRITSDGRVYIGATSGGNADNDDLVISGSGKKGITICSTNGSETRLVFADGLSGTNAVVGQILYDHSANRMDFYTSTNRRVSIDNSSRLMVGTITEGETTADNLTIADSGHCGMTIRSGSSSEGNIFFSDGTSGDAEYRGMLRYEHNNDAMVIKTANAERLRITSTGAVKITGADDQDNFEINVSSSQFAVHTDDTDGEISLRAQDGAGGTNAKYMTFWTQTTGQSAAERMRIDTNGYVQSPYNPAFFANGGTGGRTILPGNTKIGFDAVNNSIQSVNFSGNSKNSGYSTSNSRFTAPVTGTYHFTVGIYFYGDNSGNICAIVPRVNGSEIHNGSDTVFFFSHDHNGANNQDGLTQSGSLTLNLAANDYVEVWRRNGNIGNHYYYKGHSHFCGYLVG